MSANYWGEVPFRPIPRPWEEMLSHCSGDAPWPERVLAPLLQHIIEAGYSRRLFGYTAWAGLFVTNHPNIVHGKEELLVSPTARMSVRFEYSAMPLTPVEFAREYAPEDVIKKFDSFVAMVRW